jgi:hypothetical protein
MNILPFRMLILHHNQRKNTKKEREKLFSFKKERNNIHEFLFRI